MSYPTGAQFYGIYNFTEIDTIVNTSSSSFNIDGQYRYGIINNGIIQFNQNSVGNINIINSILLGGGGESFKPGAHAIINNGNIDYINNYGTLIGGGGGGCYQGGSGGPGGGGGGGGYGGVGGSLFNSASEGGGGSIYTAGNGIGGDGMGYGNNNASDGVFNGVDSGGGGGYGGGKGGDAQFRAGGGGGGGGYGGNGSDADYTGGNGGYGIYNTGNLATLCNSQGNFLGPLFYAGNIPVTYKIRINSESSYGQLYCTGWYWTSQPVMSNIAVDNNSDFIPTYDITISAVLVGNFTTINTQYTQQNNQYKTTSYYWRLLQNGTTTIGGIGYAVYNLIIYTIPPTPDFTVSVSNGTTIVSISNFIYAFDLWYSTSSATPTGTAQKTSSTTSNSIDLTSDLTNGLSYYFYAKNKNSFNIYSNFSSVAGPIIPFTTPSALSYVNIALVNNYKDIQVTLSSPVLNGSTFSAFAYRLNSTGSYTALINPVGNLTFTITTGLTYGISYTVQVKVISTNAGESAPTTSTQTLTPFTTPAAPTINSIAPSNGSVTLTYEINSNNGNDITGNTFTYGSVIFNAGYTNVNFTNIVTTTPTSNPYTLSLTNGTPYYFKLTSSNDAGASSDTIFTKYVTPTPSPFKGYSETYSNAMTISTDSTGYNTNFNTDSTNNYGHYFNFISGVTTFTNLANIYAAGGGTNIISGIPAVYNGGHAINIAPSITIETLKNYGNLLGGGGGGVSTNTGHVGGYGGAGGGGGGLATTNSRGANGSENGGAGGGGGAGGYYHSSTYTYIPGVTSTDGGGGYGGGNSTNGGGGGGGGNSTTGGKGGYSIYNGGNITSLYNSQGGSSSKGPLFYAGNMPTNYYIRLNSVNNYGQLYYTGWGATTSISSLNMNIQIDTDSNTFDSGTTFPAVLVGNFANIDTTSKAATGNLYYWNLSRNGTTNVSGVSTYVVYDLVITATDNRPSSGTGIITASSLSLSGYVGSTINQNYISSINNANTIATNTGNLISATAAYRIASGVGFTINSDKRIKKNTEPLSSSASLQIVKALKPSSFQYVDFMKGGVSKYGYLAQEVEAVIPNVVNRNAAYIPNFFEIVEIEGQNKIGLKEKTTESLEIGTKLQFYDIHNNVLYREVGEIVDEKTFIISEPLLEIEPVFLYGQFVDDYRSIDNDQINTVLLSALQECSKKIERQEQKLDDLEKLLEEL